MTSTPHTITQKSPVRKSRPLIDLCVCIVIPFIVLMKFRGDSEIEATTALIVALAFPLVWGLYGLLKYRKFNFNALLGMLLTGGIGLLQLDP